jgi:hypothetical protein
MSTLSVIVDIRNRFFAESATVALVEVGVGRMDCTEAGVT